MTVRLERISRYPVKGVGGHDLGHATLVPGHGLPYDRCLGVANGVVPVQPRGRWTTSGAFYRLAKNPVMARFSAALLPGPPVVVRLESPDGAAVQVRVDDADSRDADLAAANEAVRTWLPPGPLAPPELVWQGVGQWDHPDATVSLLNLDTLSALADAAGRPMDHRRFRGNLYVSGLGAWGEFALVGRRLRLGPVELEVLRPTDRCRATLVGPDDGSTDLNVPALLAMHTGHMYCGVYARVVTGGTVSRGDVLTDVVAVAGAVEEAAAVATAPPIADWPRPARVTSRVEEGRTATSLWLHDPLGAVGAAQPGQHVRLHLTGPDGPVWRCYTVSAAQGDHVRVSARGRSGAAGGSALVHGLTAGSQVLMTGPFGSTTLDSLGPGPLLLLSAGIGITPTVAMLRHLVATSPSRPVRVLHVERRGDDLALWDEVVALAARLPAARLQLHLTSAGGTERAALGAMSGRPRAADVAALVDGCPSTPVAFVCGPDGFRADMHDALVGAGVPAEAVRQEVFYSPSVVSLVEREPPLPGPFRVRFASSGVETTWHADDGSLLDLAEAAGLAFPSGCRAGACGTCVQPVEAGSTVHLSDPVLPPDEGTVLLCCAVPTADVTVSA